jgi:hypothetical protein
VLDESTARDIALAISLQFEGDDIPLLAPLADASLVWLGEAERARIAAPIVETLWTRELREDIERGLEVVAERWARVRRRLGAARADLDLGPRHSRLARAVVNQAADQLAGDRQRSLCCLLCVEEGLERAPAAERRARVLAVARVAGHAAAIPETDVRAAVVEASVRRTSPTLVLATDERRAAVHAWLRRIAVLGATSLPATSAALAELLEEPTDDVWREAVDGLVARLDSIWN